MAERFINNLNVGPDLSTKEMEIMKLYKQVASLIELSPIFVHVEIGTAVSGAGIVAPIGTSITYDVPDVDKLNMTIYNRYIWEVSLVNTSITTYPSLIIAGIPTPQQPLFIKLDNLTNEPYHFVCSQPIEKQNNRVVYLNQSKFPTQLNIKYGHCAADQNSPVFGTFFDFNADERGDGVIAPFSTFYNQRCSLIRFRIQIRQIHTG
jgi:hypothetical protein